MKQFFIFLFSIFSLYATEELHSLDYLYVNANTGQSSGGHSAIRLGQLVYHFQYFPDKIFHIIREPWEEFRYVYGIQENRTILIRKIKLSKKDYDFFIERMNEIYLYQRKELDNLERLQNDFRILESMVSGDETLFMKAAGYFSENTSSYKNYRSLKRKIVDRLGSNFILKHLTFVRSQLNNYKIPLPLPIQIDSNSNGFPKAVESFSIEYIDLLSNLKALEIIQEEQGLKSNGYFAFASNREILINESIFKHFIILSENLEEEILKLLESKSANTGYPLLVLLARYQVLQKSIKERKVYFLDSFGRNHFLVIGDAIQNKSFLTGIYRQISKKMNSLFLKMAKQDILLERDYTIFEDMANREREVLNGLGESIPIRINYELMLPTKEESVYLYRLESSKESLNKMTELYKSNRDKYELSLQRKYSFNLFKKNCTTEIFHSINSFFEGVDKESREKLGGVVRGDESFVFIPVYAYYAVGKNYRVVNETKIPSLRTIILERNISADFLFSMRESSTFTSKFYKFNKEDSFFIFFTDDVFWQRPIYGFVNLIAGLGELGLGIIILPLDRGEKFVKGLQGIFFSGPELLFFNIRKGTFIYEGKPDWMEED